MRFGWDWITRMVPVPYLPTLGPVHPDVVTPDVFADLLNVSGTGRFLPYDKEQRWARRKDARILTDSIMEEPRRTVIPTLAGRTSTMRLYAYGPRLPDATSMIPYAKTLCFEHGAKRADLLCFSTVAPGCPERSWTRLYLKIFASAEKPQRGVVLLNDCAGVIRDTFGYFADQMAENGFRFLHHRIQDGTVSAPIMVAVEDHHIVGALGPLQTWPDAHGVPMLLPQYFAVLPAARGHGHGRALWRAAMHWGSVNGATYQLLQATLGSPAEALYASEGLTTLGYVGSVPL